MQNTDHNLQKQLKLPEPSFQHISPLNQQSYQQSFQVVHHLTFIDIIISQSQMKPIYHALRPKEWSVLAPAISRHLEGELVQPSEQSPNDEQ